MNYTLYGFIHHLGRTRDNGHYIAHFRLAFAPFCNSTRTSHGNNAHRSPEPPQSAETAFTLCVGLHALPVGFFSLG